MGKKRVSVDWKRARRLYERDRQSFTAIAAVVGVGRDTVAAHAKAEGWVDPATILREASGARGNEILRRFIERDADAIAENLTAKHQLTSRILRAANRLVDGIESQLGITDGGEAPVTIVLGEGSDIGLTLRRVALVAQTVEVVDRSLANLSGDGGSWRSAGGPGRADSAADEAAVQGALDELAADEPASGRPGAEGEMPD